MMRKIYLGFFNFHALYIYVLSSHSFIHLHIYSLLFINFTKNFVLKLIFNLRKFSPSKLRGPLMEDYRRLIKISRKPTLPVISLRQWLVAGTATAAIYVLSRYMLINSSY